MNTIYTNNEFQIRALAEKADRIARNRAKPKRIRILKVKAQPVIRMSEKELRERALLRRFKDRALSKGVDFDLTPEWLAEKLLSTHCEATGIEFQGAGNDPFGLTFDRIDNAKGYTVSNVWVTCWIYNRCKLNSTHEDVMRMARALVGN